MEGLSIPPRQYRSLSIFLSNFWKIQAGKTRGTPGDRVARVPASGVFLSEKSCLLPTKPLFRVRQSVDRLAQMCNPAFRVGVPTRDRNPSELPLVMATCPFRGGMIHRMVARGECLAGSRYQSWKALLVATYPAEDHHQRVQVRNCPVFKKLAHTCINSVKCHFARDKLWVFRLNCPV